MAMENTVKINLKIDKEIETLRHRINCLCSRG